MYQNIIFFFKYFYMLLFKNISSKTNNFTLKEKSHILFGIIYSFSEALKQMF